VCAIVKASVDDPPTLLAACGALRASTLADDSRSRVSKGLDHAKQAASGSASGSGSGWG
jgi:hypothetical protein